MDRAIPVKRQYIDRRRENMKNYAQVYVKNSIEAAQMYCKAFGAEITFEIKNDSGSAYEHCE